MAVDVPGTGEEERLIWRSGIGVGGKKEQTKWGRERRQHGRGAFCSVYLARVSAVALIF